jgi:hypothetical protein
LRIISEPFTSLAAHHGREAIDYPLLAELERWKSGPKVCHEQSSPLQLLALERSTAAPSLPASGQPNGRALALILSAFMAPVGLTVFDHKDFVIPHSVREMSH